jgi:hypothetical protein
MSKFINNNYCSKSELYLTRLPSIQTSITNSQWDKIETSAKTSWTTSSLINFRIPGSNDDYIDLNQIQLFLKFNIQKTDGVGIGNENIAPVNNFLHSLFKNIVVKIGTDVVSTDNAKYSYRAYLENLLGYNAEEKQNLSRGDFWFDDDSNLDYLKLEDQQAVAQVNEVRNQDNNITTQFKAALPGIISNSGFKKRNALIKNDKSIELSGNLHLDVSSFDKLLVYDNDVDITLEKNDPKFYFLGNAENFKVNYENAYLLVRRVNVLDSVKQAHASMMESTPALYPFKQVVIKEFPNNYATSVNIGSITKNDTPSRIVLGFVLTEAFTGNYNLNPYNFLNLNVEEINVKLNNNKIPYSQGITVDFNNNNYFEGYSSLFKNIGMYSNGISYEKYKNGYTLFAFNLKPDLCPSNTSVMQNGELHINCKFKNSVDKSITAIVYMEFDRTIQIDKLGKIIKDYT